MNNEITSFQIWFVTGSQSLYGKETLLQVAGHAQELAMHFDEGCSCQIVFKPVLKSESGILNLIKEANYNERCIGLITWMHTFSPAKMWIGGLKILNKPLLHLHTQFNSEIPWESINMDFMNLNQSAHGGREFGFINTRMYINRKIVVGHWKDPEVNKQINDWARVAFGWYTMQNLKIARLGDNMRDVAVTEGNKVSAQITFGFSVNGYGMGDLKEYLDCVDDTSIKQLVEEYNTLYIMDASLKAGAENYNSLREAAKIEIGLRSFLEEGGFSAFTDTFENLHGLKQLPGIAVQRLMADGYGFGAEGDWKTAALVRTIKAMASGLQGGNSFMEDYTYHFSKDGDKVLGSHMLEICPSLARDKISCQVHPLGIGGKEDPVRLVFNGGSGKALNASLIDLGNRFRLVINEVEAQNIPQEMPNLPVARVLWEPMPNLQTAAHAWILAGGAHHTCYSENISSQQLEDFADTAGIETLIIDEKTVIRSFKQNLRNNEVYFHLKGSFS